MKVVMFITNQHHSIVAIDANREVRVPIRPQSLKIGIIHFTLHFTLQIQPVLNRKMVYPTNYPTKRKTPVNTGVLDDVGGLDETRTRDPMRDRHVF